ncbi:glutamate-rich protein 3-like [Glandiceps talaboti]
MSHVDVGPLASYNSLTDQHLVGYFNNTRMRRHLVKAGLITRRGEIISEQTYRLNMARKEHRKHVRNLIAQAIVHKSLDMERHRHVEIKRKLEEIAKIELVDRVKSDRSRRGDEDVLPYLSPRHSSRQSHSARHARRRQHHDSRPNSRPQTSPSHARPASTSSQDESDRCGDSDGHSPSHKPRRPREEVDSQYLVELDQAALQRFSLDMADLDISGGSPYRVPVLLPQPPPKSATPSPRASHRNRAVVTRDGKKIKEKTNKGSLLLHKKEPAYPHPTQLQSMCDITLKYEGRGLNLSYERQDDGDEIMIFQQHCGGENLCVFKGLVNEGDQLVFTSRRHRGYPFSATVYINGIQDIRVSACCEYKYRPGKRLGGSKGHFSYMSVEGGYQCYKCQVAAEEKGKKDKKKKKKKSNDEDNGKKETTSEEEKKSTSAGELGSASSSSSSSESSASESEDENQAAYSSDFED